MVRLRNNGRRLSTALALWACALTSLSHVRAQGEMDNIEIVNVDRFQYDGQARVLYGEGNVEIIVREPITEGGQTRHVEMRVKSEAVVLDREADTATFEGNVRIEREDLVVRQERLVVQLESRETTSSGDVAAAIDPEFFPGLWPVEPLYVSGDSVQVAPERNYVEGRRASLTSCSLAHPHYGLFSRQVDVRPGRRMVLHQPKLRVFGKTILTYPWDVPIPLNRRQSNVVPAFGDSMTEGMFIKFAFPYESGDRHSGAFRVNLTEKRGVAVGAEHFIDAPNQQGELYALWEPEQDSFVARGVHYYDFSSTFYTETRFGTQSNSGFALGSTRSSDFDFAAHNEDDDSSFELGFRMSRTETFRRSSQRTSIGLRDYHDFGGGLTASLNATFRDNTTFGGLPNDLELSGDIRIDSRDPDDPFDWGLRAERRFDLDGDRFPNDATFQVLERYPELTVNTTHERLGLGFFDRVLPWRGTLSFGNYRQQPVAASIRRTYMRFDFDHRRLPVAGSSDLEWSGGFAQSFYSDSSAQYVLDSRTSLLNRLSDKWRLDLDWDYLNSNGAAPLRLDAVGVRNTGRAQLSRINRNTGSRLFASTGFDFERNRWQDAIFRGLVPVGDTSFDFSGGYSLDRSVWRPLVARVEHYDPNGLTFGISSRYDIERSELGRVRAEIDLPIGDKWRIESLLGYNPLRREFDFADVRLTRDLHCWVASVTYSQQQQLLLFNLGVKAFPVSRPPLGLGTRGEMFDTTPGQYY
ncbi:MAG: hypothetical protein ACE5R4_16725 [Armatimonadota bacterium]